MWTEAAFQDKSSQELGAGVSTDHSVRTSKEKSRESPGSILARNLKKKKIPRLDALRAFSALIVIFYHFGISFFPAGLGVMTFFVISGFLITWLLLIEVEQTGTVALGHFYFRRSFRIFPAFYVFWAITVAILLKHRTIIWGQAIATFFYVGNYYQGLNHYPATGLSHAWSLGVEEQYYLLWPAMVLSLRRRPLTLLRLASATILIVWFYRLILVALKVPEEYIYTAFDTRIDQLLMGCVVAISLRYGYLPSLWRIVSAKTGYILFSLCALVISSAIELACGPEYRDTIGFIVEPVLIALLLVQLLASDSQWLDWMDCPFFIFLGTISYSTYLYHELAGSFALKLVGSLPKYVAIFPVVLAAYCVAAGSYLLVEKPLLKIRYRIDRVWSLKGPH